MDNITNKPTRATVAVKNAGTLDINAGTPVVLNLSSAAQPTAGYQNNAAGFEDGLQVVLPSAAGATKTGLYTIGITTRKMSPQIYGEAVCFNVVQSALIVLNSRAASTDVFATAASVAADVKLRVNTAANALETTTVTSETRFSLLDTIETQASTATAAADTRLFALGAKRVFIRHM